MNAVIVTPARPGTRHGNRNTALRWAAHLRALGHRVSVQVEWDGEPADCMIALHARRSHASLKRWKEHYPSRPLVLVLTGTDLYRDIHEDAQARQSLDLADRLVVLQEEGLKELNARHRARAEVIHQSVRAVKRRPVPRRHVLVTVIGHLRDEKDPFRTALALGHLDPALPLQVVHLGGAMGEDMTREALEHAARDHRYRWLGELPHALAMRWLARSHAMVISSHMEGGAHVVSEAIGAGVPVIASRISGNVGLLGKDYAGYYQTADAKSLARLLKRCVEEPGYLKGLTRQVMKRRALVDPRTERRALARLMVEMGKLSAGRRR